MTTMRFLTAGAVRNDKAAELRALGALRALKALMPSKKEEKVVISSGTEWSEETKKTQLTKINKNMIKMNNYDGILLAKAYTENVVKIFLEKHGLMDEVYNNLIKEAVQAMEISKNIEDFFNTLTNGAVKIVADKKGNPINEVYEEFAEFYFNGNDDK